jgi:hypothetical protein
MRSGVSFQLALRSVGFVSLASFVGGKRVRREEWGVCPVEVSHEGMKLTKGVGSGHWTMDFLDSMDEGESGAD